MNLSMTTEPFILSPTRTVSSTIPRSYMLTLSALSANISKSVRIISATALALSKFSGDIAANLDNSFCNFFAMGKKVATVNPPDITPPTTGTALLTALPTYMATKLLTYTMAYNIF